MQRVPEWIIVKIGLSFFLSVESSSFLLNKVLAFRERKLNRILLGLSADVIMGSIKIYRFVVTPGVLAVSAGFLDSRSVSLGGSAFAMFSGSRFAPCFGWNFRPPFNVSPKPFRRGAWAEIPDVEDSLFRLWRFLQDELPRIVIWLRGCKVSKHSWKFKARPPWFEFWVYFDFFVSWYRRSREASFVKISIKTSKERLVKYATEVARLLRVSLQSCTHYRPSPKVQSRWGDWI